MQKQKIWAVSCGGTVNQEWVKMWPEWKQNKWMTVGCYCNFPLFIDNIKLSREQIANSINAEITGQQKKSQARIISKFAFDISIGDYVVARVGKSKILGIGRVVSDIGFFETPVTPGTHQQFRKINWMHVENSPVQTTNSFFLQETVEYLYSLVTENEGLYAIEPDAKEGYQNVVLEIFERFGLQTQSSRLGKHDQLSMPKIDKNKQSIPELKHNINKYSNSSKEPASSCFMHKEKELDGYKIFISYRRSDDGAYFVPTLSRRLLDRYGDGSVFYDVDNIPLGVDFRDHLRDAIEKAELVLVVMGEQWMGIDSSSNLRRIDRTDDFVRIEVEAALEQRKKLVPILVGRAQMPKETDLPKSLAQLAFRNGAEVRTGKDFELHMQALIAGLDSILMRSPP